MRILKEENLGQSSGKTVLLNMWPRNREAKLKYGNAKHCLLSLDEDHQAHMHLRFSALKRLALFTWSVKVVFQMDLKFPTKQLIPSFCADWFLFNWSHCSHMRSVSLAQTSHLRMEASTFRRRDSQRVCWIHTFLAHCSSSRVSGSFPVVLIAPLFHRGGLTDA